MEESKNTSEKLVDAASSWIDTYRSILTIRAVEHSSKGVSLSIFGLLAMFVLVFVLLFSGLGAAWWIGEKMENMKAGFFIVGAVYAIVLTVLLMTAKKLLIPGIRNLIIKKFYEQD